MRKYIFEGKQVSPYHYYKRKSTKGSQRKNSTRQIPCSACKKPLWITDSMYRGNPSKRFCCDTECRKVLQSKGKNLELKGGYTHNTTGYHYIRVNGKPTLYHRALMEKHLNRPLKRDEHVHHMNGVRDDNRIENLAIVSNKNHPTEKLKYIQSLQGRIRELEKMLS